MALLTAAQARALYLPSLTSSSDTDIDTAIARAEVVLATWLRWPAPTDGGVASLAAATHTFYIDGPDYSEVRRLSLPIFPIASVTSVHDDVLWSWGSSTEVASSQWTLDKSRGSIMLNPLATHAWSGAPRAIRVICSAGFATTHLDVLEAIGRQVAHSWRLRDTQDQTSHSAANSSTSWRDDGTVCREARAILNRYQTLGM